ncbi:MAG: LysR family transcriptional regulator [Verrucomicrobia bacterium]|jgi:DNA-binding transcriptional LysR family regulator|nr:LysR family transcriptional regulator [Verrucomicrobiota bacterium]
MNELLFSKSGLSLDRLKSFCLVAEAESFTKAAGGNSNRQTQFSRQIKELEEFFGTELFQRKGRTVTLSNTGRELHVLVSEYFSALEDFHERCSGALGSYTIGAGESIIQWRLIPKLREIKDSFEKADVIFKNLRTRTIIDGINKGSIDFGIIRKSALTSGLESVGIGSLDFALFLPQEAATKTKDEAALLSHLPIATMEGVGSYQSFLEELPAKYGIMLKKSVSCSSFPMMARTLKVLGIAAILPEIAKEELTTVEFEMRKLDGLQILQRDLCLCWNQRRAKMNPALQKLGHSFADLLND